MVPNAGGRVPGMLLCRNYGERSYKPGTRISQMQEWLAEPPCPRRLYSSFCSSRNAIRSPISAVLSFSLKSSGITLASNRLTTKALGCVMLR